MKVFGKELMPCDVDTFSVVLIGLAVMFLVLFISDVWPVEAATPMDGMFLNVLGSMPLWGQVMVGIGGLVLAVSALALLSHGPTILIGIVMGFAVLVLIVAATGGSLFNWIQSVVG